MVSAEPFVGRVSELERLRDALDDARSGRGRVVMLVGEPGIGKTRLAEELEHHAKEQGARVLWGRAHEASGAPPYWPWVEVIRAYASSVEPDELQEQLGESAAEVTRIAPQLRQRLPDLPELQPAAEPEYAQFLLFDAVTEFVKRAAGSAPLVLVFDDLHWADRPTLLLLQHLTREIADCSLLVIGTYRDVEVDRTRPLRDVLTEMSRAPAFERVRLRGLSENEVGAYTAARFAAAPDKELVRAVSERTEGNPFFMREVVSLIVEAQPGEADAGAVALPEGVRDVIGRRLDRLSEQCNELLRTAAVLGREFSAGLLARMSDDADAAPELLEAALSAGVIAETERPGEYRLAHALIQETLVEEVRASQRVRLHGRIAEALQDLYGGRAADHAAELGHHFVEAATLTDRHAEQAFRYSKLAAEQAEAQAGWGEAARRYEDCLTLIAETAAALDADEPELLVAAGRCYRNANAPRDAWRRLLRAIDLYRNRQDAIGMAGATLEALQVAAPPIRRTALAEAALDDLGDTNPEVEARLLGRLLTVGDRGSPADEERRRERATELAERHNLADVRAMIELRAASDAFAAGRYNEAAAAQLEAQRQFEALGLARDAAGAYAVSVANLTLAGQLAEARLAAEDGVAYARRHHLPGSEESTAGYLGGLLLGLCDFDALATVLDEQAGAANYRVNVIAVNWALQRGDLAAAREALPAVEAAGGIPWQAAQIHAMHARTLLLDGDRDAAEKHFIRMREGMQATNLGREIGGIRIDLPILQVLAEAGPVLADVAFLGAALDTYRTYGDVAFMAPSGTSARELYGRYALALDEVSEAEEQFVATLEWAEREGAPVIAGQCHQGLAEVAVRRGKTADAMQYLETAGELFEQHGAKLYLDQVRARLEELRAPARRRRASYPAGLTEREVEVLRLVAAGKSNPEIAEALSIALNTVTHHMTNIFNKLGVANRAEAAVYAVEHDLNQ